MIPQYIKMIMESPENYAMKNITIKEIKKNLNDVNLNVTDRRIMLDMALYFPNYKRKVHGIATYMFSNLNDLKEHIKQIKEDVKKKEEVKEIIKEEVNLNKFFPVKKPWDFDEEVIKLQIKQFKIELKKKKTII
jgi:hypothetical protein